MSVTNCVVTASGNDGVAGTYLDTSATLLIAMSDIDIGEHLEAYAYIDTSPIGTDVISAATLYWTMSHTPKHPRRKRTSVSLALEPPLFLIVQPPHQQQDGTAMRWRLESLPVSTKQVTLACGSK
jgi:hypothetical protein